MPFSFPITGSANGFIETMANLNGAARRRYVRGQIACLGDVSERLCLFIEQGGLAVRTPDTRASSPIVEILGIGGCICHDLDGVRFSLIALLPTTVLAVPVRCVQAALQADHALALNALERRLSQHSSLVRHGIAILGRRPIQRVASALVYLSERLGDQCSLASGSRLAITQDVIASTARVTRQTANRELQRLRDGRYIHLSRSVTCIIDRPGLVAIASGASPRLQKTPEIRCKLLDQTAELQCQVASAGSEPTPASAIRSRAQG